MKKSKIKFSNILIVNKIISNFELGASRFENLKNLNKSENSSRLKVPDVGIKKTTLEPQSQCSKGKYSEFIGPRNHPKTVRLCALDHNNQIGTVFGQFLSVVTSDLFSVCCAVTVVRIGSFE